MNLPDSSPGKFEDYGDFYAQMPILVSGTLSLWHNGHGRCLRYSFTPRKERYARTHITVFDYYPLGSSKDMQDMQLRLYKEVQKHRAEEGA